jgi:hypothetical protein
MLRIKWTRIISENHSQTHSCFVQLGRSLFDCEYVVDVWGSLLRGC